MVLRKNTGIAAVMASALLVTTAVSAQTKKRSSGAERKEVGITVYNQSFGLVREVREIDLGTGPVQLEFADVAATIQPETVHIKAQGSAGLRVLEQNYRYDLLTPQKLLEKYVGKQVRVHRYHEHSGKEESHDALLLSVADGRPVLNLGGEITYDYPGRLSFPKVPDNLIAKPTLLWLLDGQRAKETVEVTYLAGGLNWRADYVLVLDESDLKGDLTGWVTLTNQSGTSYQDARLKLVAGDVNRVSDMRMRPGRGASFKKSGDDSGFQEEAFFEYHLYTLQEPTDVLDNEQKQVTLLEAKDAGVDKRLIFYGQPYWFRGQYGQVLSNQKIGVYLDLKNSKQNGLGMPLPKGTVRVYKADKSGAKQFVGEDRIDHTPKDEKIRVKMGEAFDVVGDRKQMAWNALGHCTSESTWEISLRNHKDTAVTVEDYEPVGGDWTIVSASHPHDKKDAFTFTFTVQVPANGETKISYRVRVKWC
jgi:hypothetical protein